MDAVIVTGAKADPFFLVSPDVGVASSRIASPVATGVGRPRTGRVLQPDQPGYCCLRSRHQAWWVVVVVHEPPPYSYKA